MKDLKLKKQRKPKILKCICGRYTLKEICPLCGKKTFNPNPPKFSFEDKYGKQRRKVLYERC